MAARRQHPYVPDQIKALALDAKARGLGFEEWWREAMPIRLCPECGAQTLRATCDSLLEPSRPEAGECGGRTRGAAPPTFGAPGDGTARVIWPTDSRERREWLDAVDSAKDGWRAAYDGAAPERRHEALTLLRAGLRQIDEAGPGGLERTLAVA